MPSSLPISNLVNVSINLAPSGAQMQNTNTLLVLGTSTVIDVVERLRNYTSLATIATDFGVNSEEYAAAVLYYEQSPQPVNLSIGRWANAATSGLLIGAALSSAQQLISAWTGYTTPGFLATIDGIPKAIAPATFAASTNLNGIAAIIQTALQVASASTTCVWDSVNSRFVLGSGTTGVGSTFGFVAASAAVGNAAFSGNPANNDTLTLNGSAITFVTGTPAGNQVLIGGTLAATLASLAALINASVDVQITKFTASVNPAGTAVYLVAKTAGTGGNSLTLAKSSTAITVSAATLLGATAQDISVALKATSTSSGAYVADGIAAETAVQAATLFDNSFGQKWYALQIPSAVNADHLTVAAFIEAATNKHIYGVTTQEAGVLVSTDTTNIAYQLQVLGYNRTMVQFSSSSAYAVASLFGRILTVDYTGNNTVITLMYKQEPGIVPENLSTTQLTNVTGFNCNVFVEYNNNTAIIQNGVMSSGNFVDIVTGTDFMALDIQTEVYNLLYTSTNKIPQTDAGTNLITTTIEGVCAAMVRNGLLAPGIWDTSGFGSLTQGDYLAKGYYVYAPAVSSQNSTDRTARKSVPIQVAAKLAGAIHTVNVVITVNR